jgi:hypothetical protein
VAKDNFFRGHRPQFQFSFLRTSRQRPHHNLGQPFGAKMDNFPYAVPSCWTPIDPRGAGGPSNATGKDAMCVMHRRCGKQRPPLSHSTPFFLYAVNIKPPFPSTSCISPWMGVRRGCCPFAATFLFILAVRLLGQVCCNDLLPLGLDGTELPDWADLGCSGGSRPFPSCIFNI